jgi:predicted flavoprotein YhiN
LGATILEKAGVSSERWENEIGTLTGEELDQISLHLKEFRWKVRGLGGWKDAQITVGGVSLNEVALNTWESRRWPGLYIVGELLDLQGPCGGFNLHLAWKTGIQAADHLVESI